jgi:hypothetical protein
MRSTAEVCVSADTVHTAQFLGLLAPIFSMQSFWVDTSLVRGLCELYADKISTKSLNPLLYQNRSSQRLQADCPIGYIPLLLLALTARAGGGNCISVTADSNACPHFGMNVFARLNLYKRRTDRWPV